MSVATFTKDPSATLDYQIDWSDWLNSQTISSSTWTVPAGITSVTTSNTTTTATIRLSGGTVGSDYEIVNRVTTNSGQIDERAITILVRHVEAGASADISDRANAISRLLEIVPIEVAPTLTQTELEKILDRNRRAKTWTTSTAYNYGDVIVPPIRNGHRYRVITPGTSASTDPGFSFWPTTSGGEISEGSSSPALTWVEDGTDYTNIYDLRRATYEGWRLKAQKASQFINTGDLSFNQVYEHCIEMAEKFAGVNVA